MTFGPLFVLALVFGAFAAFDWRRLPFCARSSLAAATVFTIAGFQYPGADLTQVVEAHRDGLAYMVDVARGLGFATVLVSMTFLVRGALSR
jgi:hydroxypyruvate isomerase